MAYHKCGSVYVTDKSNVVLNTVSNSIANFNTQLALPFTSGIFELPYRKNGYNKININRSTGSTVVRDKVPYLFRTSGGSIDIGESEEDTLVGGTVAFNQLTKNGNFATADNWTNYHSAKSVANNELTITVSSGESNGACYQDIPVVSGHKYYISAFAKCGTAERVHITYNNAISGFTEVTSTSFQSTTKIAQANLSLLRVALTVYGDGLTGMAKNVNVFDLTQMFGSTIADYIYSLEQGTAGAGVAWFRNLFPKDYYAYNAGTLMSVKTSKHITTGFNQWDEEWESGRYDTQTGNPIVEPNQIRSKNTFKILPNTSYYAYVNVGSIWAFFYDADNNLIDTTIPNITKSGKAFGIGNKLFTTPINAAKMKFYATAAYGTTYKNDICINLSWDGERNGEYEPYVKHEYDYSGEREVERIVGYVDLGTLSWTKSSSGSYTFFYTPVSGIKRISTSSEFINLLAFGNYKSVAQSVWSSNFPCVCKLQGGNNNVLIADHNFDDKTAEEVATALSGTYLVYELATPYTETVSNPELRGIPKLDANNKLYYYGDTCSDLPNPQAVDDFGTEEYVDNREVAIPVGHDTFYSDGLTIATKSFGQTIYGGEFNSVTGELTSSYNADGTQKQTPDIIQLTPLELLSFIGNNNIWSDTNGNSSIKYKRIAT